MDFHPLYSCRRRRNFLAFDLRRRLRGRGRRGRKEQLLYSRTPREASTSLDAPLTSPYGTTLFFLFQRGHGVCRRLMQLLLLPDTEKMCTEWPREKKRVHKKRRKYFRQRYSPPQHSNNPINEGESEIKGYSIPREGTTKVWLGCLLLKRAVYLHQHRSPGGDGCRQLSDASPSSSAL